MSDLPTMPAPRFCERCGRDRPAIATLGNAYECPMCLWPTNAAMGNVRDQLNAAEQLLEDWLQETGAHDEFNTWCEERARRAAAGTGGSR